MKPVSTLVSLAAVALVFQTVDFARAQQPEIDELPAPTPGPNQVVKYAWHVDFAQKFNPRSASRWRSYHSKEAALNAVPEVKQYYAGLAKTYRDSSLEVAWVKILGEPELWTIGRLNKQGNQPAEVNPTWIMPSPKMPETKQPEPNGSKKLEKTAEKNVNSKLSTKEKKEALEIPDPYNPPTSPEKGKNTNDKGTPVSSKSDREKKPESNNLLNLARRMSQLKVIDDEIAREIETVKEMKAGLEQKAARLKSKGASLRQDDSSLKSTLQALERDARVLKTQRDDLTRMRTDIERVDSDLARESQRIDTERAILDRTNRSAVNRFNQMVNAHNDQLQKHKSEIQQYNAKIRQVMSQQQALKSRNDEYNQQVQQLRERSRQAQQEYEAYQADVAAFNTRIDAVRQKAAANDRARSDLGSQDH